MNSVPFLSFMLVCRNDSYMGNYQYRLRTCINYLAQNLKRLGRLEQVEVVVADWNSDTPISKVLPLTPEAAQIVRFVYVPPEAAKTAQLPDQVFHSSSSMNTALRRSQGQFLMMIDADTLMPYHSLKTILELVEGKFPLPFPLDQCFFLGDRRHIPWEVVQREPALDEWDRYLLLNAGEIPRDEGWAGLGMCQIAWLAHRDLWHTSRGFDQALHYWGWNDAELTLRMTQNYPWMNLGSLGVSIFHMEHWAHNQRSTPRKHNPHTVNFTFENNDASWGLGDFELDLQPAQNVQATETFYRQPQAAIAPWQQTREQVLAELAETPVEQHVEAIAKLLKLPAAAHPMLRVLAWYSLYHLPQAYLEFGFSRGYGAAVVAAACPNVEVYGLDDWQGDVPSPDIATGYLRRLDYHGYTRLVSGDQTTAFQRLRDSAIGGLRLDLVLLKAEKLGERSLPQLSELIPYLAPGGAIVVTAQENFDGLWANIQQQFPQFTCLNPTPGVGLLLAAQLSEAPDPSFQPVNPMSFEDTPVWKNFHTERQLQGSIKSVEKLKQQLQQAQTTLHEMERSKFWKLHTAWMRLKQAIGRN